LVVGMDAPLSLYLEKGTTTNVRRGQTTDHPIGNRS
jgi:hypothetical protein